jgi:hypothetical protein
MALTLNTFATSAAIGNREDLSDIIYRISPTQTPVLSMASKSKATSITHEWQTQDLAAASPTTSIVSEGADATTKTVTPTVRLGNKCQINSKSISVSGTQTAVNPAGRKDELAYQLAMISLELKRDMEAGLLQNDVVGTAPNKARGLRGWVVDNVSTGVGYVAPSAYTGTLTVATTDGTQRAFTETLLKTALQAAFTSGGDPDNIILPPNQKQTFSTFTGNATRYDKSEDAKLYASVDVYVSDFGELSVAPDRFFRAANREAFILQADKLAIAYLRPFTTFELATTGDAQNRQIVVEWTLECRAPKAHAAVYDLT